MDDKTKAAMRQAIAALEQAAQHINDCATSYAQDLSPADYVEKADLHIKEAGGYLSYAAKTGQTIGLAIEVLREAEQAEPPKVEAQPVLFCNYCGETGHITDNCGRANSATLRATTPVQPPKVEAQPVAEYDLFEDVIVNLRFESLTRRQQHDQLKRIAMAERQACIEECEAVAAAPFLWHFAAGAKRCANALRERG